jgi:ribosome recycling factor
MTDDTMEKLESVGKAKEKEILDMR